MAYFLFFSSFYLVFSKLTFIAATVLFLAFVYSCACTFIRLLLALPHSQLSMLPAS